MTIHGMFEQQVEKTPTSIALRMGESTMSYQDLEKRSNQVAQLLNAKNLKPHSLVGVSLKRQFDLIAVIIGILKSGHAYLPLDQEYPKDRLNFMVADSKLEWIFCEEDHFSEELSIKLEEIDSYSTESISKSAALAYVIYTSGSTGNPKGVCLSHSALKNLLDFQKIENQNCSTLQFTPISFDVHFQEIFSTLTTGGVLHLIDEATRLDFSKLLEIINEKEIERIFLPFVALDKLAQVSLKKQYYPKALKYVITAGEQLKITPALRFFFKETDAVLYNHYGPSETHVVTSKELRGDPDNWPDLPSIGFLLPHNKMILEKNIDGETELIVGGASVGEGYLGRDDLNQKSFFVRNGVRYYRTGDIVTCKNGELYFVRRKDNQIKIRGYRVELGEIESSIQTYLPECLVASSVFKTEDSESFLCAYIEGEYQEKILREQLAKSLPDYMVPRFIVSLDKIPLTPSGKIDRKNLPYPKFERPDLINEFKSPSTSTEKDIAKIWKKYLGLETIGVDDPFFDLGGTSLSAMSVLDDINQLTEKKLSVVDLFSLTTVAKQAKALDNSGTSKRMQLNVLSENMNRDIAVIAMSGEFPGANSIDELLELLDLEKNTMQTIDAEALHPTHIELARSSSYVFKKGEIATAKYFDHQFFGLTPREAELMDPQQRKFLEKCYQALEASGHLEKLQELRVGIFAGSANNTYQENLKSYPELVETFGEFNVMTLNEKDYLATKVAFKLGLNGPAVSLNTGCSTSLVAIIQAVNAIRLGQADIALAGGVSINGQRNIGHLHQKDSIKSVDGLCRAFSEDATGTMFTEGVGVVVLKDLIQAQKDGDYIYSVIKGVGINNDGADKMSFSAPSPTGQARAIIDAFREANIDFDQLSFIEAHGTGTPIGDPIEVMALEKAFGELNVNINQKIMLGSLKSNLGHMTAAAGVGGFIKSVLSLNQKRIFASLNISEPNAKLNIEQTHFELARKPVQLKSDETYCAGVSSFGIGGTNAHVVIESYQNPVDTNRKGDSLFLLSAKNSESLKEMCLKLDEKIPKLDRPISRSLLSRQRHKFNAVRTPKRNKWRYFEKLSDAHLVFAFPGQGSQYLNMGKELREWNQDFFEITEACFEIAANYLKKDLRDVLYGTDGDIINDTYFTQPALFIFEYGLAQLALKAGLKPDMMIGHSVGEFVAATLNKVFTLEEAISAICKRSELMSALPSGSMMSVALSEEEIKARLPSEVDIAAINAMNSTVVAGESLKLKEFETKLEKEGIACKHLHTSHAFHSHMMKPMVNEFQAYLQNMNLKPPTSAFLSTVTGKIESELFSSPEYWARHVVKPVRFAPTVNEYLKDSLLSKNALFLELGPRETLSSLIKRCGHTSAISLSGRDIIDEKDNFIFGLASAYALGISVNFDSLNLSHGSRNSQAALMEFKPSLNWLDINLKEKSTLNIKGNSIMNSDMQLKTKIAQIFEDASGVDILEFSDDTCFFEMGMDSLFLTQVALKLKSDLGVEISFRQLTEELSDLQQLSLFLSDKVEIPAQEPAQEVVSQATEKSIVSQISPMIPTTESLEAQGLEGIIQTQLALMQNQLALLSGQHTSSVIQKPTSTPSKSKELSANSEKPEEYELKAEVNNTRKAFGAIARIETNKSMESQSDNKFITELISDYTSKTKSSKEFTQKARKDHADPRAVTGFKPEHKEIVYPIVVKSSKAQKLIDLDDNEYIDMLCGFGSNFFGNRNQHIQKRIQEQLDTGFEIGPQHPLTAEVSALINELTGNERSAFCNTGSEAVLSAMRIARTITGKKKIISFNGSYHGINDEVIIRGSKKGETFPAAPGINKDAVSNMIVLEYGDESSYAKLVELVEAGDIAAVIVEPVQSRRSDFHPKEFLKKVRELTEQKDICLIFDEVITGFRIALGGAQEYFDIRADICTYGKIVGGGMPIGVVSGKSKYLDALDGGHWQFGDDSTPTVGVTYFAGTFVRHPLALAAAKGALEILKDIGEQGLRELNNKSDDWVQEINSFCLQVGAPLRFANFGALMKPKWTEDYKYSDLFFASLRMQGIHCYDGFPWFINLAHTETELDSVKRIIKSTVSKFQNENLMPGESIYKNSEIMHQDHPPREGLTLGRDLAGFPKWYDRNGLEVQI